MYLGRFLYPIRSQRNLLYDHIFLHRRERYIVRDKYTMRHMLSNYNLIFKIQIGMKMK